MHSQMRRLPAERARHAKRRPAASLSDPLAWENPGSDPANLFPLGNSAANTNNNVDAAAPVPPLIPLPTTSAQTTTKATVTSSVKPVTPSSSTSPAVTSNTTTVASEKSVLATSTTAKPTTATSTSTSSSTSSTPTTTSSSTPVVTPSTPPPPSTSQAAQTSMVIVVPTTSPTITASPNDAATSGASQKGLSGGAIGGIVALVVLGVLAITVFIVRKRYLRRRQRRRNTWGAGIFPDPSDFERDRDNSLSFNEKPLPASPAAPLSPFDIHGTSVYTAAAAPPPMQSQMVQHSPASYTTFPPPPPASYNNPIMPNAFGTPIPSMLTPGATAIVGMARAAAGGSPQPASPPMARMPSLSRNETTVKYSFIPSLPDELSISTGERVTVSGRYDDGWALCINGRGEQGMVPQECLEDTDKAQGPIDPPQYQDVGDWRNAKRKSSLAPAGDRMF